MTPTKLLIGQILIVLAIVVAGLWAAKQWAAAMLGYQAELGRAWFTLGELPIYRPWALFPWWPSGRAARSSFGSGSSSPTARRCGSTICRRPMLPVMRAFPIASTAMAGSFSKAWRCPPSWRSARTPLRKPRERSRPCDPRIHLAEGARAGDQLVKRNPDVQPTLRIRPGWPLRILVHQDLMLSPWSG